MIHRSNGALLWSAVAITMLLVVLLLNVPGVVRAALGPRATAKENLFAAAEAIFEKYDELESTYIRRFEGRSAFFEPPQPTVSRSVEDLPPALEPEPEPEPEPRPVRRPDYTAIGGRPLTRLHGDLAVFDDGTRLHVGEQSDDLTLLEVHAPWSARVKLRDWEYDVDLFQRSHGDAFFDREDEVTEPPVDEMALAPTEAPAMATANVLVDDDRPAEEPMPKIGRPDPGRSAHFTPNGGDLDNPADPTARGDRGRVPELLDAAQINRMTHQELMGYASELAAARFRLRKAETPEDRLALDRINRSWEAARARLVNHEQARAPRPAASE